MNEELSEKYQRLVEIIKEMGKVCIAFSGGVDSAFLLKVSRDILDEKRVLAVTAVSNTYIVTDKHKAVELAKIIGVKHITLETEEMGNPEFIENNEKRCYFCKKSFNKNLVQIAYTYGFAVICDGSNTDDLNDNRLGKIASDEYGIRSPLIEAGISKDDVLSLSRDPGLAGWDSPANACPAGRIPYSQYE